MTSNLDVIAPRSPTNPAVHLPGPEGTTASTLASDILRVEQLAVGFGTRDQPLGAVDNATFHVRTGETVCLVGESGCGKTVTALSLLRLEEHRQARILRGDIRFEGRSLRGLSADQLDELRGRRIAMIFQEPMTAFDPVFTIGEQLVETIVKHDRVTRKAAFERGVALLERVQIPDAELRMSQIPQQLSGGMRQRAMIAMALSCGPKLLVADEPTTALDVTIQAQILALLKELQRENGMGILLITHDLAVAAQMADRVVVMYAGRVVEQAPVAELFANPGHPYTRGLLRSVVPHDSVSGSRLPTIAGSIPRLDDMPEGCRFHPRCPMVTARCRAESPPLVSAGNAVTGDEREVACFHAFEPEPVSSWSAHIPADLTRALRSVRIEHSPSQVRSTAVQGAPGAQPARPAALLETNQLSKHFVSRVGLFRPPQVVRAVDGVSLQVARGETFGLVGESGCGKSTLGRVILQLEPATAGHLTFEGTRVDGLPAAARQRLRRDMQMIFQDPYGSIDPRWKVGDVVAEPLVSHEHLDRASLRARVDELLTMVGLSPAVAQRHAHELSGGQRQRIGIARAIALRPKFVLADEPVSALDLSVQAQIINLLCDLRERLGLTCLFIGHGLNAVRHLSDRTGVMYLGRLVEVGRGTAVFRTPAHHYTKALLDANPVADPARRRLLVVPAGELPSPTSPPSGCHFHPRCPAATARCRSEAPRLRELEEGRLVACHFPA